MTDIIKASGEKVSYDSNRLRASLKKVGADNKLINIIVDEVDNQITEGISTSKIYAIAFRLLRKHSKTLAARYHLKKAIMRLGTTGYPFEKYVALLLMQYGHQTKTNQIIQGHCITHEVDVIASKNNHKSFIECKYHNRQGKRCDVKVPLYIKGRFIDIAQRYKLSSNDQLSAWVVTNTRFTSDAEQYGVCAGLKLISWNFPETESLKEMIEITRLYPITCISSLTRQEVRQLLDNGVIVCKTLADHPEHFDQLRLSKQRKAFLLDQCQRLCDD